MGAQQAKESRSSGKEKHSHRAKPATATTPTAKVEAVRPGHSVNIFTEHSGKSILKKRKKNAMKHGWDTPDYGRHDIRSIIESPYIRPFHICLINIIFE